MRQRTYGRAGLFLVEVGVPDLRRLPPGQDTVPFAVNPAPRGGGYIGFDQYDVVTQQFTCNHVTVSADGLGGSDGSRSAMRGRPRWI